VACRPGRSPSSPLLAQAPLRLAQLQEASVSSSDSLSPCSPGSGLGVPPLEGSPDRIAAGLRDLAEAGADEAILVVSPITERSSRLLGETPATLDGS
jgi:alkanesulfonate monooxygenase SsuD/methylene tetrahydromethanopterin reductase-like flavin-dependent oxidoreductase (luciferase family)